MTLNRFGTEPTYITTQKLYQIRTTQNLKGAAAACCSLLYLLSAHLTRDAPKTRKRLTNLISTKRFKVSSLLPTGSCRPVQLTVRTAGLRAPSEQGEREESESTAL